MNYNKIISVEDYNELVGHEPPLKRKEWEVQMALRTLRDHGAVHPEAEILGAGAGHEVTIYHLSTEVRRVFASDLYITPGVWGQGRNVTASAEIMANPAKFAPEGVAYDLRRIVMQHGDMLDLPYPDDTFDGIFSSGSIEHVGELEDVARAAAELGRVLKPGGILSLSTEYKISGDGHGWPGVLVLTYADLMEYIIRPSGCEMVDNLADEVDDKTLETAWRLDKIVVHGQQPPVEAVLRQDHYLFTSVHLALRKPEKKSTRSASRTATVEAVEEEIESAAEAASAKKSKRKK